MTLEAKVTHTDGSTDTLTATRSEEEYKFGEMDMASVFIDRPQVNNISLTEGKDEVEILEDGTKRFGGVLREVLRGGGEVELTVDTYERYALDAEPSGGDLIYDAAGDDAIVSDAISDIPQLSAGTVDNSTADTSFVFPFTSPGKRIRTVAGSTGLEVEYAKDKTVNYTTRRGTDKTESQTGTVLSPASQNISGDFLPENVSGNKQVTHLVMLGAGEGQSQVSSVVVPNDDPYDYEGDSKFANVRRYTANNWSSGDDKKWDTRSNKDYTDSSTLGDLGVTLVEEFNAEYIDVEVTVEDEEVYLGDSFTVENTKENISKDLRAVEVTRIIDTDGRRYEVIFSNRRVTRETEVEKEIKDTERYNRAFEGTNVMINPSGGRQPVTSNLNYDFSFYYPDEIEYEHRVKLFVKGLPYRAYSSGAASGGDHTHSVDVTHPSHDHSVSIGSRTSTTKSAAEHQNQAMRFWDNGTTEDPPPFVRASVPDSPSGSFGGCKITATVLNGSDTSSIYDWDIINEDSGFILESESGVSVGSTGLITYNYELSSSEVDALDSIKFDITAGELGSDFPAPLGHMALFVNSSGQHSHDIDIGTETSTSELGTTTSETSDASGGHTHDADPGVIQSFGSNNTTYYPKNCDVVVNGTTINLDLGDGTSKFNEQVDLSGYLTPGQENTVEVTSEQLGHISAHLDIDAYRQILGRG